jgi:hypothetical protein
MEFKYTADKFDTEAWYTQITRRRSERSSHGDATRTLLIFAQLGNKFLIFYGTKRFVATFKRAHHWTPSPARSIQSTPSRLISILLIITFSLLRLGLPSSIFPLDFLAFCMHFSTLPQCPPQLPSFHVPSIMTIWWRVQFMGLLISRFHLFYSLFVPLAGLQYSPQHRPQKLSIYILTLGWQTRQAIRNNVGNKVCCSPSNLE